jgi:hypothetical protein
MAGSTATLSPSSTSSSTSSALSNAQVATAAVNSGSAVVVLNAQAHAVANQPQFPQLDVQGLENVNAHLTAAQNHANAWLNTYSGEVLNTLQGVVSFGELFTNLYGSLYQNAQNLGTQTTFNQNQISALISEIKALQGQVQSQLNLATQVYNDITTYSTDVNQDYSNFKTDYNTAQNQLGGDSGAIKDLQDKIDSENSALTKDALMIAGGAVGIVAGALCIAAGVLGEFESGGTSTLLIVAGISLVAAGGTVTGIGAKNYDDTLDEIRTDTVNLGNMQNELKGLNALSGSLTNLTTAIGTTQGALQTLMTSWQQLDNGLAAVVSDLQSPEDYLATLQQTDPTATPSTVSIIVSAELQTANQDWQSALTNAKTLLGNLRNVTYLSTGSLPTQQAILQSYQQAA